MNRDQIIERLVEVLPPMMDETYGPDRCLNASRHGRDVLAYFGIDAKPVKTQAIAGNRVWHDWIVESKGNPQGDMPEAAWSVGVDLDPQSPLGGYPGHLCLLVAPDILLDLSLGQLARPQHDMLLPPAAAIPIEPGFDKAMMTFENDDGDFTSVAYRLLPERDWMQIGGWRRKPELAGQIIREIRQ